MSGIPTSSRIPSKTSGLRPPSAGLSQTSTTALPKYTTDRLREKADAHKENESPALLSRPFSSSSSVASERSLKSGPSPSKVGLDRVSKTGPSPSRVTALDRTSKTGPSPSRVGLDRTSKTGPSPSKVGLDRNIKSAPSPLKAGTDRTLKAGPSPLKYSSTEPTRVTKSGPSPLRGGGLTSSTSTNADSKRFGLTMSQIRSTTSLAHKSGSGDASSVHSVDTGISSLSSRGSTFNDSGSARANRLAKLTERFDIAHTKGSGAAPSNATKTVSLVQSPTRSASSSAANSRPPVPPSNPAVKAGATSTEELLKLYSFGGSSDSFQSTSSTNSVKSFTSMNTSNLTTSFLSGSTTARPMNLGTSFNATSSSNNRGILENPTSSLFGSPVKTAKSTNNSLLKSSPQSKGSTTSFLSGASASSGRKSPSPAPMSAASPYRNTAGSNSRSATPTKASGQYVSSNSSVGSQGSHSSFSQVMSKFSPQKSSSRTSTPNKLGPSTAFEPPTIRGGGGHKTPGSNSSQESVGIARFSPGKPVAPSNGNSHSLLPPQPPSPHLKLSSKREEPETLADPIDVSHFLNYFEKVISKPSAMDILTVAENLEEDSAYQQYLESTEMINGIPIYEMKKFVGGEDIVEDVIANYEAEYGKSLITDLNYPLLDEQLFQKEDEENEMDGISY